MDVDIHLVRNYIGDVVQHSFAVDATYFDCRVEEHLLVHVPLRVENLVAETCLELVGHLAVALMYFYPVLVVDVSEDVVAGYRVAASGIYEVVDGVLGYDDRLFLVESFLDNEQRFLLYVLVG